MRRASLRLLGWVLLCLLAIGLGRQSVLPETRLALFWPAAGVGALWVLSGRRVVLDCVGLGAVVAAYFLLVEPMGIAEALLLGAANVAQALVVRRVVLPPGSPGGLPAITSTRQLSRLFAAAFAAAGLGSVLGAAAVWTAGGPVERAVVLGWVVRNGCSTFVVAAAALTCLPGRGRDRWRRAGVGSTRRSNRPPRTRPPHPPPPPPTPTAHRRFRWPSSCSTTSPTNGPRPGCWRTSPAWWPTTLRRP